MTIPVHLRNLKKAYGDKVVLPRIDLEIGQGEFFTLLGPSGCGKTTLLRMIAGFNSITDGTIAFGDRVVNDLAPFKRNIGMVFQNYAVFPHLTVRGNLAFGLKNRGLTRKQIAEKVERIMEVVQITEHADKLPKALSGGQQQRVALARAIVIEPSLLLMDEPLSNLDAKLRVEMREAIREIQRKIGITTIYVTHDQEEAMAVSDRIAVLNQGRIDHLGSPDEVFLRPATRFVAGFIGRTNFIELETSPDGLLVTAGAAADQLRSSAGPLTVAGAPGRRLIAAARPHDITISASEEGIPGEIRAMTFLGPEIEYRIATADGATIQVAVPSSTTPLSAGTQVGLLFDPAALNLFDAESEARIDAEPAVQR